MLSAGKDAGIQVLGVKANTEQELMTAIQEVLDHSAVFVMVADATLYSQLSIKNLLVQSLKRGVPVMGISTTYTRAGALFSVECDYADLGKQAGELVEKIMRNEPVAGLKPAAPRQVRFTVNLAVAGRLGITIPEAVVARAREVVE
jgi:putative ABC transport system substrate-binding protein